MLKLIIQEYPNCLDLEFVETFLSTTREKIEILNANLHPLTHYESVDQKLSSNWVQLLVNYLEKIVKVAKKITDTYPLIYETLSDIEKRA